MDALKEKFSKNNYEERKCTNITWVYKMIAFIALMFAFVIYSSTKADIRRVTNGYDNCGYVCGVNNQIRPDFGDQCLQSNKEDLTMMLIGREKRCVTECPNNHMFFMNFCIQKIHKLDDKLESQFAFLINDLTLTFPAIGAVCCITLVFSYILILLFRHCAHYAVWGLSISFVSLLCSVPIHLWYKFAMASSLNSSKLLYHAIIYTFLASVSVAVLIFVRDRIKLVVQLFNQTAKVLLDIPALLAQPIFTFIATVLAITPFIYFAMIIESSGTMQKSEHTSEIVFKQDIFVRIARVLNIIAFIWFSQFLIGCQHFVVAGTVSKWYFTRDKTKLVAPMLTSYNNLFWYHLGSICLGSWIITIVKIITTTLHFLAWCCTVSRNIALQLLAFFINWLIAQLDLFLRYLVRSAYIIVAKDGYSFFKAASKSNDIIFKNLVDVLALNHVGDLVLTFGRLFVVLISGFVGFEMMSEQIGVTSVKFPMILAVILSFTIVHCLVTIFEMSVDTIFLCYCEDVESNDGSQSKPYYMSLELKNVMEQLKDYGAKNNTKKGDTSDANQSV